MDDDGFLAFLMVIIVILAGLLIGRAAYLEGRTYGINQAGERGVVPREYDEHGEVIAWQLAPLEEGTD